MAIKSYIVSVGTTPVRLDEQPDSDLKPGRNLLIRSDVDLFLGGPDVDGDQGFELAAGDVLPCDLGAKDHLYAISAAPARVSILMGGI